MTGEQRRQFRVVGGNEALVRNARVSREARWPPLRVVGADMADLERSHDAVNTPPDLALADRAPAMRQSRAPARAPMRAMDNRAAWSQALLAGLVVVMLSSVGQAIAANW